MQYHCKIDKNGNWEMRRHKSRGETLESRYRIRTDLEIATLTITATSESDAIERIVALADKHSQRSST